MNTSAFITGGILMMTAITGPGQAQAPAQPSAPAPAQSAPKPFVARQVVENVRELIGERYVLPEMRPKIDAKLKAGLDNGRYRTDSPALLAERLTADLFEASQDGHLYVRYAPATVAAQMGATGMGPDMAAIERRSLSTNFGMPEMRTLPGNVRYLKITGFDMSSPRAEAAIDSAMAFLAAADAVIIDLRWNGGGNGRAVHQMISQFVKPDTPLISFKKGGETSPMMTSFAGLSTMVGKPLYVLTSGETASAGEEFAGQVAGYKLGEIVGEPTAGAAFMNALHGLDSGFEVSVSEARPVLAATGKDWERVGIAPTIAVDPAKALEVAHAAALRRLAAADPGPRKRQLESMARGIEAFADSGAVVANPERFVGIFGNRLVSFDGTDLWIRQERRMPRRLVPFGNDTLTIDDAPGVTVRYEFANGRATAIEIVQPGGEVQSRLERSAG